MATPWGLVADGNGRTNYGVSSGADYRNGVVSAVSYVGLGAVGGNSHPEGTSSRRE